MYLFTPSLVRLSELAYVHVYLAGEIPRDLGKLKKLESISVHTNVNLECKQLLYD